MGGRTLLIKEYGENLIVKVKKVEIEGDSLGWDIWYIDENNKCYHDVQVEEIKSNKNIEKLIKQLRKLKCNGLYFKFKYEIRVEN